MCSDASRIGVLSSVRLSSQHVVKKVRRLSSYVDYTCDGRLITYHAYCLTRPSIITQNIGGKVPRRLVASAKHIDSFRSLCAYLKESMAKHAVAKFSKQSIRFQLT